MSSPESKQMVEGKVSETGKLRKAAKCRWQDLHAAVFGGQQPRLERPPSVKDGIRKHIRRHHGRG